MSEFEAGVRHTIVELITSPRSRGLTRLTDASYRLYLFVWNKETELGIYVL